MDYYDFYKQKLLKHNKAFKPDDKNQLKNASCEWYFLDHVEEPLPYGNLSIYLGIYESSKVNNILLFIHSDDQLGWLVEEITKTKPFRVMKNNWVNRRITLKTLNHAMFLAKKLNVL